MSCREENRRQKQQELPFKECPNCGTFAPLIYKVFNYNVCSKKCKGAAYNRVYRIGYIYVPPKHERVGVEKICDYCQAAYTSKRYRQRFCSDKCAGNWHYNFGSKGQNRKRKSHEKREKLYNEIKFCTLCGVEKQDIRTLPELGAHKNSISRGLFQRDHIVPKSQNGGDSEDNLRWLCWFCNLSRKDINLKYDSAIAAAGKAFWNTIKKI